MNTKRPFCITVGEAIQLAASAPQDIPDWFEPKFRPRPVAQIVPKEFREFNEIQRDRYELFVDYGGEFPGNNFTQEERELYSRIEQEWKSNGEAVDLWQNQYKQERYFQWRLYYANGVASRFETQFIFVVDTPEDEVRARSMKKAAEIVSLATKIEETGAAIQSAVDELNSLKPPKNSL